MIIIRNYNMYVFTKILYLLIFIVLSTIASFPLIAPIFMLDKIDNYLLVSLSFAFGILVSLIIGELYTTRHPIRIVLDGRQVIMFSVFRKFCFETDQILFVRPLNNLNVFGVDYLMNVNIGNIERRFVLERQAICGLDEFISKVQLNSTK